MIESLEEKQPWRGGVRETKFYTITIQFCRTYPICVADATLDESSSLLYLAALKQKYNSLNYNYLIFQYKTCSEITMDLTAMSRRHILLLTLKRNVNQRYYTVMAVNLNCEFPDRVLPNKWWISVETYVTVTQSQKVLHDEPKRKRTTALTLTLGWNLPHNPLHQEGCSVPLQGHRSLK